MGFTDKDENEMKKEGYIWEIYHGVYVYYRPEEMELEEGAQVNYIIHPWIRCSEVEGIRIK